MCIVWLSQFLKSAFAAEGLGEPALFRGIGVPGPSSVVFAKSVLILRHIIPVSEEDAKGCLSGAEMAENGLLEGAALCLCRSGVEIHDSNVQGSLWAVQSKDGCPAWGHLNPGIPLDGVEEVQESLLNPETDPTDAGGAVGVEGKGMMRNVQHTGSALDAVCLLQA